MLYLAYAALAAAADVLPGLLYLRRLESTEARPSRTRYLVGAASGIVLAAAFFELLPEARLEKNSLFVAAGFFVFYLVEKLVMLHACGEEECDAHHHRRSWLSGVGMASDNVIDGVGITVATLTDPFLGAVVTLAVVAHEIPQGITTAILARESGFSRRKTALFLLAAGLMYPLGAASALLLPREAFTPALAVVAGVFLYVGAGDLLAEAHRKFNLRVVASVLLGAALMLGVSRLEG